VNAERNSGSASTPEACFFPERRYLHTVLVVSREADAASRCRPGSRENPSPRCWRPSCEAEASDYDGAVTRATHAGLPDGEAIALVEALWTLGGTPTEIAVDPIVSELGLDPAQQQTLTERLGSLLAPSAEETVHGLIGSYASAVRQYHRAPEGIRGEWPLFSELIPGLASPLRALRTTAAEYAATKLVAALAKMCGRPLDEFSGALWTRVNGNSQLGVGTALRGLAKDYKESNKSRIHRTVVFEEEPEPEIAPSADRAQLDIADQSKGSVNPGSQ